MILNTLGARRRLLRWGVRRWGDVQLSGEALAEQYELVAPGVEPPEERPEVVDGASDTAREAVPAVVVELEAGGAVVVKRAADLGGAVGLAAGERWHVGGGRNREQLPVELAGRGAAGLGRQPATGGKGQ